MRSRATVLTALARLTLWLVPLRVAVRLRPPRNRRYQNRETAPAMLAGAVEGASRCVPLSTCLVRALALQWLLTLYGYSSRLVIGVRRASGTEVHAWVEVGGAVVMGGNVDGFATIYSYPRGSE